MAGTATYASLTPQQQSQIATADVFYRGVLRQLVYVANNCQEPTNEAFIQANVDPVVATLAATEVIPNATSLANAQDLTVANWLTIQSQIRALMTEFQNSLALIVQAIGNNATGN
jgi:hypothetical protein